MNDFNKWIKDAQKYISKCKMSLCTEHEDGRTNSSIDEDKVVELLVKKYGKDVVFVPKARKWYDIWHKPSGTPINIKVSSLAGADNACNFLSLLWCFTDNEIKHDRSANKRKDWAELLKFLTETDVTRLSVNRDYWFFVVDKNDTSNVIINSIKQLPQPVGNPSNPPFQVNWSNNKKTCKRTLRESLDLYISICISNIKKRQASDKLATAEKILGEIKDVK